MKRIAAYLAFGLLAAAACSDRLDKEGGDVPILFSSSVNVVSVPSKVALSSEDDLIKTDNIIGVFGDWRPAGANAGHQSIFSNQKVVCTSGANNTWTYNPVKYWMKTGKYEFFAVYPDNVDSEYDISGNRLVATYSMHASSYDLMVARKTCDMSDNINTEQPVELPFKHALAAVRFLFKKGDGVSTHYYINSFELKYIKTIGVLLYEGGDVTNEEWLTYDYRAPQVRAWEAKDESERIDIPETFQDFLYENWQYVIPQSIKTTDEEKPSVSFTVTVDQSTVPVPTTLTLPDKYTDAQGTHDAVWEAGKVYNYYILIQPSKVAISLVVVPWEKRYIAVDDLIFTLDEE